MSTSMKRAAAGFSCAECGWSSPRWVGRCGECLAWGTVEQVVKTSKRAGATSPANPAVPISDIPATPEHCRPTGVRELDRVLGGGIVAGSVLLLAGEPGVGKSTLLLEVAARAARDGVRTLYVTGEESAAQVRLRAERTGALEPNLLLAAEVELSALLGHVEQARPQLLVVDSVQTIGCDDGQPAGGVVQIRTVTQALVRVARQLALPVLLVGHVTKDGAVAGPRLLEHIVDVVLHFEGERHSRLRLLRAMKNRYGPVDELGCFDLADTGIVEVADPSGLFTSRHPSPTPGSCVTVTLEGRRPLLAEVQALVTVAYGQVHRSVSGLDQARLSMLLAVLQRHGRLDCSSRDVYAATIGGAALKSPSADLAIALSLFTAVTEAALPLDLVAIGEVGLAGELRRVPGMNQRLAEASRLGFQYAVIPRERMERCGSTPGPAPVYRREGLTVLECPDIAAAIETGRLLAENATSSAPRRIGTRPTSA